jgi:hypothetical protein
MSSCDNSNIRQNYIVANINEFDTISACTGVWTSNIYGCSPITVHDDLNLVEDITISGETFVNGDITPLVSDITNIGTSLKRFRDINTISGTSTVWTSTIQVITPNLNLGLDSLNNQRTITANNSIIQDDILYGGDY